MQIGLIGMPLSGKTTIYNLLTEQHLETGPGAKSEIHVASAAVPDDRIEFLSDLYHPQKISPARIQFMDLPGMCSQNGTAAQGAFLLDKVRGADVLVQVVRAFHGDYVTQSVGEPNPYKEICDFGDELMLADLAAVENRLKKLKEGRKLPKDVVYQITFFERLQSALEMETPLEKVEMTEKEREYLSGHHFLTEKPLILAVNIDEDQLASRDYSDRDRVISYAKERGIPVIEICGLMEMEISLLPLEERIEFMNDLNLKESGITRLAQAAYGYLGLMSFFTVGEDEVRAWTINNGTPAQKAAGKIHSDIERGFIRAEVFHFDSLHELGSPTKVKEKGLFRLEGRDYTVKDGDIISFRFNV
ncbi:redox-regulated ATPase YchF [Candidatus Contubernalis alkaliaceticus]|uniref:redox-regulated ATPase YchF n=1 Tax=Candidatus Contubernalis alkaliaceticus TaxID=338645 RepID=UPI001F4C2AD9|nr:DUF933 domain-containing protein [Candidatus Contubernalis alkalaceticus]UNC92855.1 redox-regulated ATPase YchF [Candidatus Contubernalis alkalaceticus]